MPCSLQKISLCSIIVLLIHQSFDSYIILHMYLENLKNLKECLSHLLRNVPENIPLASPTLDLNSRHFTSVFHKPYRLSKKQYCLVECPRISYLMSKHCIGFA